MWVAHTRLTCHWIVWTIRYWLPGNWIENIIRIWSTSHRVRIGHLWPLSDRWIIWSFTSWIIRVSDRRSCRWFIRIVCLRSLSRSIKWIFRTGSLGHWVNWSIIFRCPSDWIIWLIDWRSGHWIIRAASTWPLSYWIERTILAWIVILWIVRDRSLRHRLVWIIHHGSLSDWTDCAGDVWSSRSRIGRAIHLWSLGGRIRRICGASSDWIVCIIHTWSAGRWIVWVIHFWSTHYRILVISIRPLRDRIRRVTWPLCDRVGRVTGPLCYRVIRVVNWSPRSGIIRPVNIRSRSNWIYTICIRLSRDRVRRIIWFRSLGDRIT